MATFVDSHAHLADPAFDADREAVIARARATGARAVICIGESLAAAARARELAAAHPGFLWHTAGIHPHDAAGFDPVRDAAGIAEECRLGAVAVGECGLDYHYDHSPRDEQRRAFAAQLGLARDLDRPVVVHTRLAEDDTLAMVQEAGAGGVRGVLHCYTGSHRLAEAALAVGWYVSFSGIVTFRKWDDDALIRLVPDNRLLVESDAPYLAPVPHRGKRNESAWVSQTLARVAEARGADVVALGEVVVRNAARFYALALADAAPAGFRNSLNT
ncbi:MAG TPA: TatD family hydrolase [Gemmatimonadaceae bacterium]|jgi:TatD DNase family protein|nr:TatD family hydrolase [Gemmatimonadaceae bacterium]